MDDSGGQVYLYNGGLMKSLRWDVFLLQWYLLFIIQSDSVCLCIYV